MRVIAYRDPQKYSQGVKFEEPESLEDAVTKYGVQESPVIWSRHIERSALLQVAQETGTSKCNLCCAWMPAIEELTSWRKWFIAMQPFPFSTADHFILLTQEHQPQDDITIDAISDALTFVSRTEGVRLIYNGAAASIDHLHFQGYFDRAPIEDTQTKILKQIGAVTLSELVNWPVVGFVLEAATVGELVLIYYSSMIKSAILFAYSLFRVLISILRRF
jgi:hypothetical protein